MKSEVKIWLVIAILLVGATLIGIVLAGYARREADDRSPSSVQKVDGNTLPSPSPSVTNESIPKVDWNE